MFINKKLGESGLEGNACFLWMYAETSTYVKVFAQFRKDGLIGAPGGKVEYGESYRDALIREVFEETGIDIRPYDSYIEPLTTMAKIGSQKHSHAFFMKVSEDVLEEFQKHAAKRCGTHSDEANGYILLPFTSWGTFHNVMGQNFSYSASAELLELMKMLITPNLISHWDSLVNKK